jgi:hypothetical protein
MTDLIFNDPAEAAAWDMYVSAFGAVCNSPNWIELCVGQADLMLLERRKRMAPPAQIVYSEQFS